jgi:hypothetical protein
MCYATVKGEGMVKLKSCCVSKEELFPATKGEHDFKYLLQPRFAMIDEANETFAYIDSEIMIHSKKADLFIVGDEYTVIIEER